MILLLLIPKKVTFTKIFHLFSLRSGRSEHKKSQCEEVLKDKVYKFTCILNHPLLREFVNVTENLPHDWRVSCIQDIPNHQYYVKLHVIENSSPNCKRHWDILGTCIFCHFREFSRVFCIWPKSQKVCTERQGRFKASRNTPLKSEILPIFDTSFLIYLIQGFQTSLG